MTNTTSGLMDLETPQNTIEFTRENFDTLLKLQGLLLQIENLTIRTSGMSDDERMEEIFSKVMGCFRIVGCHEIAAYEHNAHMGADAIRNINHPHLRPMSN
jgi:hypothetical protein